MNYRAGDILRWYFELDKYYSNHLLLLKTPQEGDYYFHVIELESGVHSTLDWRIVCGGGYWTRSA